MLIADIIPPRKENITQSESQETTNGEESQQNDDLEQNNEQDQDINNSVDIPLFRTEEGRYLASGKDEYSYSLQNKYF